ncbi:MAG: hypothetical protein ACE5KU_01260 [Nitrososphaerales archaeon]
MVRSTNSILSIGNIVRDLGLDGAGLVTYLLSVFILMKTIINAWNTGGLYRL